MRNFDLPGRSPVLAENAMAATSHPLATTTALSILKEGGNAVDAAIAASAALCVVEPHMTGIGGDCFVILAEPDGKIHGLNGSGRAPMKADAAAYRELGHDKVPENGALAVTVPGAIDAWERLAKRFGTMGFDRLFADAIRYGEEGFAVHSRVARDWVNSEELLAADEGGSRHFLVGGKAPAFGSRFKMPALAGVFRHIAREGARAFYEGEIAREMAETVQAKGGFLSEEDLAAVHADWVEPISAPYAGQDILEIPPNGQGITALILLRLMERLGIGQMAPDSVERQHMMMEAGRLAYSVRDHLVADPATMTVRPEELIADTFIDALAARVDPARRNDDLSMPDTPSADTIYLTVVDKDRRAVSFINSVYAGFGSKLVTPNTAIALQNRGASFSLQPGHPNMLQGGKRPMHTIIPAMAVKDGRATLSFGVMGGAYQPMGHALVASNIFDHGMDPQAAIDAPRLFWGTDGVLEAETGISETVRKGLEERGHQVRSAKSAHGGGQAILINHENGFLQAGSDSRKDGCAAGW